MLQQSLFIEEGICEESEEQSCPLGNGLRFKLQGGPKKEAALYRHDSLIQTVEL